MTAEPDARTRELAETIREIQARVRARHPSGTAEGAGLPLPDLLPLLHARDAAEAKAASIGSVNPRRGGPVNSAIQAVKKSVARGLNWFVRDQITFNQNMLAAVQATLDALNEANATFQAVGQQLAQTRSEVAAVREELRQRPDYEAEWKDFRAYWNQWREGFDEKLHANEVHYLRGVADLQAAFQHRVTVLETAYREATRRQEDQIRETLRLRDENYREAARVQHDQFESSLAQAGTEIQQKLWADLAKVRSEFEQLIHSELRLVRQRLAALPSAAPQQPAPSAPALDYTHFSERFRGPESYVRAGEDFYLPYFRSARNVLDIGCGRGEFLELMKQEGVPAHGIDLGPESVALCRQKGLEAEVADAFVYLPNLPDQSLGGVFCSQVIEHIDPARLPDLIRLIGEKCAPGAVVAFETPNPECLAIFATHFYLDPTHTRPVPPALLSFYLQESGFGQIEIHRRSPAIESLPGLEDIPASFRDAYFGGLDYACIARKL